MNLQSVADIFGFPSPRRAHRPQTAQVASLSGRSSSQPACERIYAIGDIHGRFDLLASILSQIFADQKRAPAAHSHIVLLGDLIDRGPASRQVLEFVQDCQQRMPGLIVLRGNHEDLLLKTLAGDPGAQRCWLRNGGYETLRSYGIDPADLRALTPVEVADRAREAIGETTIGWLESAPLSFRSGNYFFCHAGVRPGVDLKNQDARDLMWIRKPFLESERDHGAVIVHGHSETDEAQLAHNRINVDTGAHRTGRLTAVALEGPDRWLLSTDSALAQGVPHAA